MTTASAWVRDGSGVERRQVWWCAYRDRFYKFPQGLCRDQQQQGRADHQKCGLVTMERHQGPSR